VIDIRIPKMGTSTVEVDVVGVLVKPGQHVSVGDPLVALESEKVSTELECEWAGTVVEVLVTQGNTYRVGDVVCRLDEEDEG
jgi:pyruvate/2-oxoglutarate dehydrogenase complex dihydrolipoamide acyltransferase (E2) component